MVFAGCLLAPQSSAASIDRSFQSPTRQLSAALAKESREAAGEDDSDQFKHSASVQWVSSVTGLSIERSYQVCVLLNFLVVAAILFWALRKTLPVAFRKRTDMIQAAMEEARKASVEANRRLGDIETRLSKLDVEIGQMRATADRESAEEEKNIKAAAEEDARKIVESAEHEIAAAAKAARRELKSYAADLAVALAGKQIHVDPNTDHALVTGFAKQLSGNGGEQKGRN
ncbi:MAG TPA: ATP synthase F0 subunit B [Terriglobales bacterium]